MTTFQDKYAKATAKSPPRKKKFTTLSEIEQLPLFTEVEWPAAQADEQLGLPGEFPYTRGVQTSMYRSRLWTMRQYAGFGTAAESNARYRALLAKGTTGLSVAFDLPTQMGIDSDDPRADGEVGRVGVAIDTLADMEILLGDLPLEKISTSMTINATAAILLALYVAVAEKRGVPKDKLNGTIQNDVLKEYIARGTYIFPPGPSLRIVTDIFAYCSREVPNWNSISVSGYHIREAGSTAVQEVAFTLANGLQYVQAAVDAGLDVDGFAGRISFFFNSHNYFFEEAAKFRAARRLWAKLMKQRFQPKTEKALHLRFHTQTAGVSLMAQQPLNNVARVTLQALAAVLGGTQSLHTNGYDEALALPTEASATLALRTQQVIAHESGAADVIDPLGGSWYVEWLTDEIEKRALAYIEKIDAKGGALKALEGGFQQREIQDAAYRYQKAVDEKSQIIVGVNEFTEAEGTPPDTHRLDPALAAEQIARLRAVRAGRDPAAHAAALAALAAAARDGSNLMPRILAAVQAMASVGEIATTLSTVFGRHREILVV
jgi:methylmalonyl-CoA mutase N-terminal domain/subunit